MLKKNKKLERALQTHLSFLQKMENRLYEPPLLKVPFFVLGLLFLDAILPQLLSSSSIFFHTIRNILLLLTSGYLVLFIVHLMRRSFKKLLTASSLWALFIAYALFLFSVILFFSSVYETVEKNNAGYLTYGQCGDNYTQELKEKDKLATDNHFYFAAITTFTVGYGDICPMGATKIVAILNAFVGNFISVVLMVFVLSNFLKRSENQ